MFIVDIVGGALLLTLGRKIFWFFVALSGFYAGFELASRLNIQPGWAALVIGLAVGVLGAILAYFFQKLVIGVAGFLVGAFIASRLLTLLSVQARGWEWLIILLGGIIGIILVYAIFDWALIILSSLAGAILVVNGLGLVGLIATLVGVALFVIGVIFQAGLNQRDRAKQSTS